MSPMARHHVDSVARSHERHCRAMATKKTANPGAVKKGAKGMRKSVPRPRPVNFDMQVSYMLSRDMVERLDRLVDRLRDDPVHKHHRITRASLLRECIEMAIDGVEARYATKG